MCVKDVKYMCWVKIDLFECFRIEEIRDKENATGFERGRRNRNVNYSAFHIRDARSPSLKILTLLLVYFCIFDFFLTDFFWIRFDSFFVLYFTDASFIITMHFD